MKRFAIAAIAAIAPLAAAANPVAVDCKRFDAAADGAEIELVLPAKGSGTLDFHFSFAAGHARMGGTTAALAACKIGEKEGKPVFSTVYRARVIGDRAVVKIAMPEKGEAQASVVVGDKTFFGRLVVGEKAVRFGEKLPGTSWKAD